MRFETFIARRYLRARRKQVVISFITFISVLGVTMGVAAPSITKSISPAMSAFTASTEPLKGTCST